MNSKIEEKHIENNSHNDDNKNNEKWETDSDEPYNYFRVKFDTNQKVKQEMKKILSLKSKKIKKLDIEANEKLKKINKYLTDEIFPTFGIKTDKIYTDEDDIDKIFLINNEYNILKKPELGSSIIFELKNKNNLNLLGVSQEYFEAGTKIYKRSRLENYQERINDRLKIGTKNTEINKFKNNYDSDDYIVSAVNKIKKRRIYKNKSTKKQLNLINKKLQLKQNLRLKIENNIKIEKEKENNIKTNSENNIKINTESNIKSEHRNVLIKNKNKKRNRRIKRYIKNSTIITINKINK